MNRLSRSPNFTALYFYFWGQSKALVWAEAIQTAARLQECTIDTRNSVTSDATV
jgi:hypothetical protein